MKMPGGAFEAPNPNEVGGAWGAGVFPPWFQQAAQNMGMDYMTALNEFARFVSSEQPGPNGQHVPLGWYWDTFRPGGANYNRQFTGNSGNFDYNGPTDQGRDAPPPPQPGGEDPVKDPPAGAPPPADTQNGMPSSPPGWAQGRAGRWRPRIAWNGQRSWEFVLSPVQPNTDRQAQPTIQPVSPSMYPDTEPGPAPPPPTPPNPPADPDQRNLVAQAASTSPGAAALSGNLLRRGLPGNPTRPQLPRGPQVERDRLFDSQGNPRPPQPPPPPGNGLNAQTGGGSMFGNRLSARRNPSGLGDAYR